MTLAIIFLATIAALILIILVVVVFIVSFSRRRDPLPPDLFDGDMPTEDVLRGVYLATYEEGWSKPVSAADFLRGGPGIFYIDNKGVNFLLDGSRQPVHLPFDRVIGASVEKVEKGDHKGSEALVVTWTLEDRDCRSAFVLEGGNFEGIAKDILTSAGGKGRIHP